MKKLSVLLYGIVNYNLGSASLVCLIAFIFNLLPENPILGNIDGAGNESTVTAFIVNLLLISLFAVQHSVMARPAFKKWLTRTLPKAAERSTYMLTTAIVVFTLIAFWQPMTATVWSAETGVLYYGLLGIGLTGWALVFYATFLINHFDLFGLRQVWLYFRGKEYTQMPFKVHSLYRYIRHPIMTGVFIGIWVTPVMTLGHFVFAMAMSLYIMAGVYYEEKDLIQAFGQRYLSYMRTTAKFFPVVSMSRADKAAA